MTIKAADKKYKLHPQQKQAKRADQIWNICVAAMLNKHEIQKKNMEKVEDSLILNLSQSFPPKNPPITQPSP